MTNFADRMLERMNGGPQPGTPVSSGDVATITSPPAPVSAQHFAVPQGNFSAQPTEPLVRYACGCSAKPAAQPSSGAGFSGSLVTPPAAVLSGACPSCAARSQVPAYAAVPSHAAGGQAFGRYMVDGLEVLGEDASKNYGPGRFARVTLIVPVAAIGLNGI